MKCQALNFSIEMIHIDFCIEILCRLEIAVAETYGEEEESILQTAKLWQKNVSAIFGPVETCIHEVRDSRL